MNLFYRIYRAIKKNISNYAEYNPVTSSQDIKDLLPYSVTTKTISYYTKPSKRDPARRWK